MAKQSKRSLLIAGLMACGWREYPSKSTSKHVAFENPDDPASYYFVGKSAGLRRGTSISKSVGLTGFKRHAALIELGGQADSFVNVEQAREALIELLVKPNLLQR